MSHPARSPISTAALVVINEFVVADVDEASLACPVVEQATISSRDPMVNRIWFP